MNQNNSKNAPKTAIRFDSVGGASGDLILSSLIDLGLNHAELHRKLSSLSAGIFKFKVRSICEHGIKGKRLSVDIGHSHHHHHRHLAEITSMIRKSRLSAWVKDLSIEIFRRLAAAEARVHNTTPDKIHFHEVGAVDSIVDIVGSCQALEMLGVTAVTAGPLPIGYGTVKCEHGILPLPAPAVAELLRKYPVVQIDEPFETVTPTGAVLLTAWQELLPLRKNAPVRILKSGTGFGHHRYNERRNILRATLMELPEENAGSRDECLVLECNLDDTTPELIGNLCQKLIQQGALDVFTTPVQMKKQRPGTLLTVLCRPAERNTFTDLIFAESTTFGIREHVVQRTVLQRRHVTVKTRYGRIRVKIGTLNGRDITASPEYEDCAECAVKHGIPIRKVYELARRAVK